MRGEAAGETRPSASVAALIGADVADVALIASVSAAAGLVAGAVRSGRAGPERRDRRAGVQLEPLPVAAARRARATTSGRSVPQRRPRARRRRSPRRRRHRAGRVQRGPDRHRPPLRHRGDQRLARAVGATVFVDGSQLVGAMPVADDLARIDVLATADHKFLMHAGRGLGYCYLAPEARTASCRSTPDGRPARPARELLRPGDGPVGDRVAVRQLDQLARRGRQRGRAVCLRRVRRRRVFRAQP